MPPKVPRRTSVIASFILFGVVTASFPVALRAFTQDPPQQQMAARADWWSLRPLVRPEIPAIAADDNGWVRSPIDAFVAARLRQSSLSASPEADRRTLIRRLTFDLHGLPPTPDAVREFVDDSDPDAYERLVDRLLASPRYGERWARHWMDIVHFAETHGHDQDRIRENAWPYRDYLIAAFNSDRAYRRFIEEQLAVDALFPDRPDLTPALGFIAAGPWDESSLRDIREDTLDRQIGHYLDRDDMVTTTMSTFASLTVHCARCHDHKFDPITQREYYRLQAVFAGVGRANRQFDDDPAVHERRLTLRRELKGLERNDGALLARLREPAVQSEIQLWETSHAGEAVPWRVLDPIQFTAAQGTTLAKEADGVVFASGTRPEKDTYAITARSEVPKITAVRLEVLDDDRLPKRGPGRQDNGNLHLSEIRMETVPLGSTAENSPGTPLVIAGACADHDQTGWTVQHAIDGDAATAWGIYPEVGKRHEAVFELKQPALCDDSTGLRITLEQLHGGGHLIGKLRLSVTDAPLPVRVSRLSDRIAAIIRTTRSERTAAQIDELATYYWRDKLNRELSALPAGRMVYAGAADFAPDGSHKPPLEPRAVHVLNRGDINRPGELVSAGALAYVPGPPAEFAIPDPQDEASRRAALARWLVDPRNPLTWRSIANRVWHYHFGRGIVDTPNDFGHMGSLPSHPELLDWLADEFRVSGGSIKQLDRLIVTSATYRQASAVRNNSGEIDADNRLLWRANRLRLDAESVRDAILQISGHLDLTMGGPSDRQFSLKPGIHVTPLVNYSDFDWSGAGSNRRSVYRFIFRTLPDPFMTSLDCADASQLTATRNVSVTPLQALVMLNNEFLLTHSERFARWLESLDGDLARRCEVAFEVALGRPASAEERAELTEFAARNGLAALARVLFNSSEFMFVN